MPRHSLPEDVGPVPVPALHDVVERGVFKSLHITHTRTHTHDTHAHARAHTHRLFTFPRRS